MDVYFHFEIPYLLEMYIHTHTHTHRCKYMYLKKPKLTDKEIRYVVTRGREVEEGES